MSTTGLIIGGILAAVTVAALLLPFLRQRGGNETGEETFEGLQVHYERVLTNIRDLDEDYSLGKIQPDFYESERAKFTAEGVALLRQMEQFQPSTAAQPPEHLDDTIEAAIAARRKQQAQ